MGDERNLNALCMYRHTHTHNLCETLTKGILTIKINITSSLLEDIFGSLVPLEYNSSSMKEKRISKNFFNLKD